MGGFWTREPVMFIALVQTALALAVAFGFTMTAEQVGAVLAFTSALLGFITRTQVTPMSSLPAGVAGKIADNAAVDRASRQHAKDIR